MGLSFEEFFRYPHSFNSTTAAHFNRYPNPFAQHVLSCDTLESRLDSLGNLHTTRLVVKRGRLPKFIAPFFRGDSLETWIIERIFVNPRARILLLYTANIDHRRFVKIEEYLRFAGSNESTDVHSRVLFLLLLLGLKRRIEEWSSNRFRHNLQNTRDGLLFVMNKMNQLANAKKRAGDDKVS